MKEGEEEEAVKGEEEGGGEVEGRGGWSRIVVEAEDEYVEEEAKDVEE